jgi:hypothetical protein
LSEHYFLDISHHKPKRAATPTRAVYSPIGPQQGSVAPKNCRHVALDTVVPVVDVPLDEELGVATELAGGFDAPEPVAGGVTDEANGLGGGGVIVKPAA